MQQLATPLKAVAHGFAIGNGDRGQLDKAGGFDLVGQSANDVANGFFNRDFPCVAQRRGNRLHAVAPLVLIALIEMVAFVGKLVGQAGGDVGDAPRLERRLA